MSLVRGLLISLFCVAIKIFSNAKPDNSNKAGTWSPASCLFTQIEQHQCTGRIWATAIAEPYLPFDTCREANMLGSCFHMPWLFDEEVLGGGQASFLHLPSGRKLVPCIVNCCRSVAGEAQFLRQTSSQGDCQLTKGADSIELAKALYCMKTLLTMSLRTGDDV